MINPLMQVDELNDIIRQLQKIDSKLQAGQIIGAYRENRRIMANMIERKRRLVESQDASQNKQDVS